MDGVSFRQRVNYAKAQGKLIVTPRLVIMPLQTCDAEDVFEWVSDPNVTEFMTYSTYHSVDETVTWLKEIENGDIFGFFSQNGQLIGSGGIAQNSRGEYELGYNLARKYWGKGYCTEASKALLARAVSVCGVQDIVCKHALENVRSGRVIQKCGFSYLKDGSYECYDGRVFACREYTLHIDCFQMYVDSQWFDKIVKGSKTVELRLNDEKRRGIKAGDYITLINNATRDKAVVSVSALHYFSDFDGLYRNLDMGKCGYGENDSPNPQDMLSYYDIERQKKYGVVGIEFSLLCVIPSKD